MWAEPPNHHTARGEAPLSRLVENAVVTGGAGSRGALRRQTSPPGSPLVMVSGPVWSGRFYLAGCPTDGAPEMVGQVRPSSSVQGLAPLQGHRGVVELAHDGAWSRGGAWGGVSTGQRSNREHNQLDEPRGQRLTRTHRRSRVQSVCVCVCVFIYTHPANDVKVEL